MAIGHGQYSKWEEASQMYLDMERLEVWETSEVARHLLESIAYSKSHQHGQDLDRRDNVLLGSSRHDGVANLNLIISWLKVSQQAQVGCMANLDP